MAMQPRRLQLKHDSPEVGQTDPVTKRRLNSGDWVIVCPRGSHVHLESSWEFLGGKCSLCGETGLVPKDPKTEPLPPSPPPPPPPNWLLLLLALIGVLALAAIVAIVVIYVLNGGNPPPAASATPQPMTEAMPPAIVVTATPGPTAPATATSQPSISDIRFCSIPCDQPGASSQTSFPAGVSEIYYSWKYQGMRQGMAYSRSWTNRGQAWITYACVWQGPESGIFTKSLYERGGGLRSGTWTVTFKLEDSVIATASINVAGNNNYWAPLSGNQPCPDW